MRTRMHNVRRRRHLVWVAAAAAGGFLVSGAAAEAAQTNTNLVVNGGFENVDPATLGDYSAPRILDWVSTSGFAYSHDGSASSGGVVPDYADGADPPNAGHWYFTSNNAVPDITGPGQFYQDIDVSQGETGAAIAGGSAEYNLSAFMSSYLTQSDFGVAHVEFSDSIGTILGAAQVSDSDPGPDNVWNLVSVSGTLPVGTANVRLSLYGVASSGGPDGYIDNVEFNVTPEPSSLAAAAGFAALALSRRRTGRRRPNGPPS